MRNKKNKVNRIEISKNLLLQTTTTISSIAEEIGFYDLSHFSRVFIAKVGISPTEYRKQKGKKWFLCFIKSIKKREFYGWLVKP